MPASCLPRACAVTVVIALVQVCARATAARFLSEESRAAHEAGQLRLQQVLRGLMQQHALCSPSLVGDGVECSIEPPLVDLWFDGAQLGVRPGSKAAFGGLALIDW